MPPLPARATITEVGPRDGFQNEPEVIPTEQKVRLIGMLADSGLKRIEELGRVAAGEAPYREAAPPAPPVPPRPS